MKIIIVAHIMLVVVIVACREWKPDPIPAFIPGTYIRSSVHEFGSEHDTLVITHLAMLYVIERKWMYGRVLDGRAIEPEYKKTSVTGIYNKGILTEQQTGAQYSFDPDKNCLYNGDTRYDKF